MPTEPDIAPVALHEATRHRYLNYALSVITSRALPDVRDGLKPVQRRILYAMDANLKLRPDSRFRKSAAVVGEVMAKYHPHGDQSIYDALVRMAQPFSLRHPLVDGQGNFGSLDGDPPAAMRYTECKLRPLAMELLSEIGQRTVDFRTNYDGQHDEPVVLPAQVPQLLINGAEGIAVGMATRIPPHNLGEVIDACVAMIANPDIEVEELCTHVRGPDFPTGGVLLDSTADIRSVYETGGGSLRLQSRWTTDKQGRRHLVVITEIPYSVNKASLVERIGGLVAERKLPQVVDVRDESTDEVRIVMELRKAEDAEAAMAYVFKHTPAQTSWHCNLTCLVPDPNSPHPVPIKADLHTIIRAWLDFRLETVTRRFQYELEKLRERIHILEGFAAVFQDLDLAIRLIRESEGKRDARDRLMDAFDLDDVQAEKVLELQLYRLARLPIADILDELEQKRERAAEIEAILSSRQELWAVITRELLELRKLYAEPRRTTLGAPAAQEVSYEESEYIVSEEAFLIATREGWIKRQGSFTELSRIRIRDGDEIGWLIPGNTRSTVTFFSDQGAAYGMRLADVPATTGYGDPIQKHFKLADGERVVGVVVHDEIALPEVPPPPEDAEPEDPELGPPHGVAVTVEGRALRFPLAGHVEPSQRTGRRYMRVSKGETGVLTVEVSVGGEHLSLATHEGNALAVAVDEIGVRKGAARGMQAIKLKKGDSVLAGMLVNDDKEGVLVVTSRGREVVVSPRKYGGSRASRGTAVIRRGSFAEWRREPFRGDLLADGEE
jgi:DNA gyrase subunit A